MHWTVYDDGSRVWPERDNVPAFPRLSEIGTTPFFFDYLLLAVDNGLLGLPARFVAGTDSVLPSRQFVSVMGEGGAIAQPLAPVIDAPLFQRGILAERFPVGFGLVAGSQIGNLLGLPVTSDDFVRSDIFSVKGDTAHWLGVPFGLGSKSPQRGHQMPSATSCRTSAHIPQSGIRVACLRDETKTACAGRVSSFTGVFFIGSGVL